MTIGINAFVDLANPSSGNQMVHQLRYWERPPLYNVIKLNHLNDTELIMIISDECLSTAFIYVTQIGTTILPGAIL